MPAYASMLLDVVVDGDGRHTVADHLDLERQPVSLRPLDDLCRDEQWHCRRVHVLEPRRWKENPRTRNDEGLVARVIEDLHAQNCTNISRGEGCARAGVALTSTTSSSTGSPTYTLRSARRASRAGLNGLRVKCGAAGVALSSALSSAMSTSG